MPTLVATTSVRPTDRSKTMSFYKPSFTIHRQRPLRTETWRAGEFPFGRPYGAPVTPVREPSRDAFGPSEIGPTFEESYPKQPFSELVRQGVALAGLVAKLRRGP